MLVSKRVDEVENNVFSESSRINSTFGGNLTDMIRFKIILYSKMCENRIMNSLNSGRFKARYIDYNTGTYTAQS